MENIIKNLHKIVPFLNEEQLHDLEHSALSYRRFARIYFKIEKIDVDSKEMVVKVWQEKNTAENYLEKKDLNERAKTLMGRFFEEYTIHTHPIPYQQAPSEVVNPLWVKERMKQFKISNKKMIADLGIAKAEISALINGHREMGVRTKGLFYYYFKYKEQKTINNERNS